MSGFATAMTKVRLVTIVLSREEIEVLGQGIREVYNALNSPETANANIPVLFVWSAHAARTMTDAFLAELSTLRNSEHSDLETLTLPYNVMSTFGFLVDVLAMTVNEGYSGAEKLRQTYSSISARAMMALKTSGSEQSDFSDLMKELEALIGTT